MKTITEFFQENYKTVDFENILKVGKIRLDEADDPFGAPAGGDAGDDPMGGPGGDTSGAAGGDPFGGSDPMGGGDPMGGPGGDIGGPAGGPGGDSEDGGFENDKSDDEDDDDENEEDDHEDDPDWTKGVQDPDDPMLDDKPAGETIYDADSVVKSIAAIRSAEPSENLKSMADVQKALELIINGKKLKIEDVSFNDPDDAMKLIDKIEEPLDIKLKNYIDLKIKQPIIAQRDKNKEEIAKLADDNDKARDTIDAMNKRD